MRVVALTPSLFLYLPHSRALQYQHVYMCESERPRECKRDPAETLVMLLLLMQIVIIRPMCHLDVDARRERVNASERLAFIHNCAVRARARPRIVRAIFIFLPSSANSAD